MNIGDSTTNIADNGFINFERISKNKVRYDLLLAYPKQVNKGGQKYFEFTNEIIQEIHDKYNDGIINKVRRFLGKGEKTFDFSSVSGAKAIDGHTPDLSAQVGNLVGKLWIKVVDGEKHLWGRNEVNTDYGIKLFNAGALSSVSIRIEPDADDKYDIDHVAYVPTPALHHTGAKLFSSHDAVPNELKSAKELLAYDFSSTSKENHIQQLVKCYNEYNKIQDKINELKVLKTKKEFSSYVASQKSEKVNNYVNSLLEQQIIYRRDKNTMIKLLNKYNLSDMQELLSCVKEPRQQSIASSNITFAYLDNKENL